MTTTDGLTRLNSSESEAADAVAGARKDEINIKDGRSLLMPTKSLLSLVLIDATCNDFLIALLRWEPV
jgi:hypothetical protein